MSGASDKWPMPGWGGGKWEAMYAHEVRLWRLGKLAFFRRDRMASSIVPLFACGPERQCSRCRSCGQLLIESLKMGITQKSPGH